MILSSLSASLRTLRAFLTLLALVSGIATRSLAEDASAIEGRLSQTAKYLSSDELEGRGVGTKGIDLAANYIAERFRELGLKTDFYDGTPFQKFKMTTGATLGKQNELALVGPAAEGQAPQRVDLKLGEQFNPMALGGSGKFDLPLVFVGYGITGKDEHYDDYAGVDVKGKAVIVLRHEPQQNNPHSPFDGTKTSRHAPFTRKISNAYEHGAAAVIFVNDDVEVQKNIANQRKRWQTTVEQIGEEATKFKALEKPSNEDWDRYQTSVQKHLDSLAKQNEKGSARYDVLQTFRSAGSEGADGRDFPVVFCSRDALAPMIQTTFGKSLAQVEAEIDKGPTPQSRELTGWRAAGEISVNREEVEVKNVVGVLEADGPLANETIIIGAHYDHLGMGGSGSAAPGAHEIHNGADDNGSGTTVLLELARQLSTRERKLPRRIVFIAFTGEERGLIGSARYVRTPLFPIDSTVAMLNLDMVGRLDSEKLIVYGTGTATEFDALADRYCKQYGFQITKNPGGFGPSDHASFFAAKVPVLFFFTGTHKDYHRPSDDFDKLNIAGMRRIGEMVGEIAVTLAEAPERPHFQETKDKETTVVKDGDRPYFGSIPDFSQDQPGYALTGVTKDGPAEKGGLKAGDIIVQFGESKIGNLEDFDSALRKYKAGDKVPVSVKRGGEQLKLDVTLDAPR